MAHTPSRLVHSCFGLLVGCSALMLFHAARGPEAVAAQSASLPAPWTSRDVGSVGTAGSASAAAGTFTVKGAGTDIYGTGDSFHYAYRQWNGDVEIIARVSSVEYTDQWALAGVMIRESLAAGSRHAAMFVTPSGRAKFRYRSSVGAGTISMGPAAGSITLPRWVRLSRTANTFRGYESADGQSWTEIGTATFPLADAAQIGLAVSSHNTSVLCTATFQQLAVMLPAGWTTQDIGSVGVAGSGRHTNGTLTISGAGADIYGSSDAFHYAHQVLTDDGEISARVVAVEYTDQWALSGVMMRESLTAGSRHAAMVVSPSGRAKFRYRSNPGGSTTSVGPGPGTITLPHWVKLVRRGSTFTGYRSADGRNWTEVGTAALSLPRTLYVGLAATSHTTSKTSASRLDSVTIPSRFGQWSRPVPWPIVAIHMNVVPDGSVLAWGRLDFNDPYVYMWDPIAGGSPTPAPVPESMIYCAGHAFLPDGRLFVAGGHIEDFVGPPDANVFDGGAGIWSRVEDMQLGRWYPTVTPLANGEILVTSGDIDCDGCRALLPEIWRPGAGWRQLTAAERRLPLYPYMYVTANGKVFNAGPNQSTQYLDTSGTGAWTPVATMAFRDRYHGSSAMFDAGKILVVGGNNRPTNTAETIDLNLATPRWQSAASMAYPRRHLNATLLPDGNVLITGGTPSSTDEDSSAILPPEIWEPGPRRWSLAASLPGPRLYHSTAALLPDGRVLSAGGGQGAKFAAHLSAELYSPAYLFRGARPAILSAPQSVTYGQRFFVGTPDAAAIGKVTWLRLSAVTHGFNENQRINRLAFSAVSGGLEVTAPPNPNLCPPGHYMLFILNKNGVPSVARIVRIG